MKAEQTQVAEIAYSKEGRELQVTLPHGTKLGDLTKIIDYLARDIFSKLPRGCTACHSGDHLIIRERLENVIRVDLNQKAIVK
jgi:hypothetical protein